MRRCFSYLSLLVAALLIFSLCGCGDGSTRGGSTAASSTTETVGAPPSRSDELNPGSTEDASGDSSGDSVSTRAPSGHSGNLVVTGDETNEIVYDDGTVRAVITVEKTGDNIITTDRENKYIKAIVEKYKVNPDYLVAIYTEPESDNNMVYEFDGALKDDGTYLRSPDNMVRLYTVTADLKIEKAEADVSVRNLKKWFSVQLAKGIIMEQHPDVFDVPEK
ncbi:MAG: hypothetical protein GX051_06595 [Clostridiales bacterium]|nr:hypothetical protein [Clostridiales bacterium]